MSRGVGREMETAAGALVDAARAYTGVHSTACREGVRAAFEGESSRRDGSGIDGSIRSTSARLSEIHAQLRAAESSAGTSLARLEEAARAPGADAGGTSARAHGEMLERLGERRREAAARSLSLLESLRTELETIEAEARREAEEEDARHERRLRGVMRMSQSS